MDTEQRKRGEMRMTPVASPSHHVNKACQYWLASPITANSPVTPIKAAIAALSREPKITKIKAPFISLKI